MLKIENLQGWEGKVDIFYFNSYFICLINSSITKIKF